jgi:hypothetical protein
VAVSFIGGAKILSNHYSSLFKERICNKFTSSYVTSKKYSRLVQVVYGVAPSEERQFYWWRKLEYPEKTTDNFIT